MCLVIGYHAYITLLSGCNYGCQLGPVYVLDPHVYSGVLDNYKEITAVSHGKEYALRFYRNKDVGMGL